MRRIQFIALAAPVVAVVVLLLALRSHEPEYGGKTLSQWLTSLERTPLIMNPEAGYALKAMGTNAIPYLVAGINREVKLAFLMALLGQFKMRGVTFPAHHEERALVRAVHLPFLIRLLHDSITEIRAFAAEVLGAVHVKAALVVPELERLLNDPELFTRSVAIDALGEYGTEAKSAVPGLVQHIKQAKGASEKETAIRALRKIDAEAAAQFRIE